VTQEGFCQEFLEFREPAASAPAYSCFWFYRDRVYQGVDWTEKCGRDRQGLNMDHLVQNLQNAYLALISAASTVLEAKDSSDVMRSAKTDAGLELFYNNLQLFHTACDQTQEFVESLRLRIGSECLVDEATGPLTAKNAKSDVWGNGVPVPSLSALRLEQMSKAVRWLVLELQPGGQSATSRPKEQGDMRTEEDANQ